MRRNCFDLNCLFCCKPSYSAEQETIAILDRISTNMLDIVNVIQNEIVKLVRRESFTLEKNNIGIRTWDLSNSKQRFCNYTVEPEKTGEY